MQLIAMMGFYGTDCHGMPRTHARPCPGNSHVSAVGGSIELPYIAAQRRVPWHCHGAAVAVQYALITLTVTRPI